MGAGRLKGQPVTIRKTAHRPSRRRAGVGAYLVAAFTACLVALGVLMAMTTASSFDREIPKGDWFAKAQADQAPVNGGVAVDALSGHVAITVALPVAGSDGAVGVLAAVLYTDPPIELPAGASSKMVLLELDGDRHLVVDTS